MKMLHAPMRVAAVLLLALLALASLAVDASRHHRHPAVARGARSTQRVSSSPASSSSPAPLHQMIPGNPVADPSAVVLAPGGLARFTVLTPSIIRMQYSATGDFSALDVQTYVVLNRLLTVPTFTRSVQGTVLIIATANVVLRYDSADPSSFNHANLQVTVLNADGAGNPSVWTAAPGMDQAGNLFGTIRTLDGSNGTNTPLNCDENQDGMAHCSWGIIGRRGYAVIDDTGAPAFDSSSETEWTWLRSRAQAPADQSQCGLDANARRQCAYNGVLPDECARRGCCFDNSTGTAAPACFYTKDASLDLYFMGHGLNFKQAALEYTWIAGKVPAPPRYMLGVFFSRYWAYADWEEYQLVQDYVDHQIPLDILVTDMDWHETFYSQAMAGVLDQAGEEIGWSGFTFDEHLFPNHTEFFLWCKSLNLRNTLNVHPASGIQPWEEKYEAMALAMGVDPASGKYVPYNITDPKYNTEWQQLVMQPLEQNGVDFWWLDWQQGESWISEARLNPTQALNYQFYSSPSHWSNGKRPGILHRWGGLGNHRYQLGFSGDTFPQWSTLAFEPFMTATAANVLYGYWSHDIGGHLSMPAPDLYTRWVQFGVFSPVFRTHCTKEAGNDRRIWMFPDEYYVIMRRFTRLRAALVPYLADHALTTYDTGLSLCLPLYYNWPLHAEAYPAASGAGGISDTSYMFGLSLLASPIVAPVDPNTQLATKAVWVPPGTWVGFFSGDVVVGPQTLQVDATLAEMPLWAVAGSIIPLRPLPALSAPGSALVGSAQSLPSTLQLLTFVGGQAAGQLVLREDAGDDLRYQQGEVATTVVSFELSGAGNQTLLYTIVQQSVYAGFMPSRAYEIHLRGVYAAASVSADGGQTYLAYQPFYVQEGQVSGVNTWRFDATTLTLIIAIRVPVATQAGDKLSLTVQLVDSPNCPLLAAPRGFPQRLTRVQAIKAQLDNLWRTPSMVYQDLYPNLMLATETASRINSRPETAREELASFDTYMTAACGEMANLKCDQVCDPGLVSQILAQLHC